MYKDCYRTYDDLRAFLSDVLTGVGGDWPWECLGLDDFSEHITKWLVDNGYEISRYEMDDDYIDGLRKELREDAESGFAGDERLNIKDLIMPPVKLDRCPEDILKEEIEK